MVSEKMKYGALTSILAAVFLLSLSLPAGAQMKTGRLSIATGGTGGIYYVMGGGFASVISKYVPNVEATAEVTAAAVDNCKLIMARKADLAFVLVENAYEAFSGTEKFKSVGKIPVRALATLYPAVLQIVTVEGGDIEKVGDLKGKRISLGAPGSATEIWALKVFQILGLDPLKDMRRERLSVAESAGALKDRKIDAFFWGGGVPTSAVLDLAATPGIKIKLLANDELLEPMNKKYGWIYYRFVVTKEIYPGMAKDVRVIAQGNMLVCHEQLDETIAYGVVKTIIEHRDELMIIHKEAEKITLENAVIGSPIPFHPGAIRYYKEKKVM